MIEPLATINNIFSEHNKAFSVVAWEIDCHRMSRARRIMICRQLKHDIGNEFRITYDPNRIRVVPQPTHRAEVA